MAHIHELSIARVETRIFQIMSATENFKKKRHSRTLYRPRREAPLPDNERYRLLVGGRVDERALRNFGEQVRCMRMHVRHMYSSNNSCY